MLSAPLTRSAGCPTTPGSKGEWWERADLHYGRDGQLRFAGTRIVDFARRIGTPAFVYSAPRVAENVRRLRAVLARFGPPSPHLYYALKANRFVPLLRELRELGVGLDVCSPGEVRHALRCGFLETDLSYTAGSLSATDYAALAAWPQLGINADSLSALRHIAAIAPGRIVGLRVNPAAGVGYAANPLLRYAGDRATKFGVYLDRFPEALALAARLGLRLNGLHVHAGSGFLTPQLVSVAAVFERVARFLDQAPQIRRLNLGGGLGVPLVAGDVPLNLDGWADLVLRYFGGRGLTLSIEPGDYLVKDAGILLAAVTEVEEKSGRCFVGLNAGFNLHPEPAFYHLPLAPVAAFRRAGPASPVTLTGNLNEALDLWAEDVPFPPTKEGDIICLLNAGAYGSAMVSAHCLRNVFTEHLVSGRAGDSRKPRALAAANQRAWDHLYGSTPELVWGTAALPFLAEFLDEFRRGLTAPSRVLDAATGEGRNLRLLQRIGADELHAVDSSARALAKIPRRLRAHVQCRQADLRDVPYPDAFFDGITLLDAIETIPNPGPVLRELARILKPDGLLLCNIPGPEDGVAGVDMEAIGGRAFLYRQAYYFQFLERPEAEVLLTRAGFEVLRCCRCQWHEPPHPGFRPHDHVHVSHVFLARRAAGVTALAAKRTRSAKVRLP